MANIERQKDFELLNEVSSVPLEQALRHQHRFFVNFWEKRANFRRANAARTSNAGMCSLNFRWMSGSGPAQAAAPGMIGI
ncbi:hypothetical protein [Glycomyces sp. YM15]|uniref:hypothetical protein n=1 Tax=Glycomyces sp. YM15 TaxID=2800446 RepID=UPI001962A008|nr:hypothetical protein [Glycomyces sp. YM15]